MAGWPAICARHGARLRAQYYIRVQDDTPYQLNQWFSSPDWSVINSDGAELGDDPAYSHLSTALGSGMVGDVASVSTGREIDQACAAGN